MDHPNPGKREQVDNNIRHIVYPREGAVARFPICQEE